MQQHNKRINTDRFDTPRRFALLCVVPSGYARRYTVASTLDKAYVMTYYLDVQNLI
jgi:hypothetical protein